MLKKLLLLWLSCLVGVVHAQSVVQGDMNLVVVGDSLSAAYGMLPEQGWVHLLAQRLQVQGYRYRVINASISGDTTEGGRQRLAKILQQHQPTIVILELGANDGLRGLALKAMRANLANMIEKSQQAGAKVILLGMRIPSNYGKAYAEGFHQIYSDLTRHYSVSLVPFFLEGETDKHAWIQADNLHPTAEAQVKLLENVWKVLKTVLERAIK